LEKMAAELAARESELDGMAVEALARESAMSVVETQLAAANHEIVAANSRARNIDTTAAPMSPSPPFSPAALFRDDDLSPLKARMRWQVASVFATAEARREASRLRVTTTAAAAAATTAAATGSASRPNGLDPGGRRQEGTSGGGSSGGIDEEAETRREETTLQAQMFDAAERAAATEAELRAQLAEMEARAAAATASWRSSSPSTSSCEESPPAMSSSKNGRQQQQHRKGRRKHVARSAPLPPKETQPEPSTHDAAAVAAAGTAALRTQLDLVVREGATRESELRTQLADARNATQRDREAAARELASLKLEVAAAAEAAVVPPPSSGSPSSSSRVRAGATGTGSDVNNEAALQLAEERVMTAVRARQAADATATRLRG
jgi:hypothetical protein